VNCEFNVHNGAVLTCRRLYVGDMFSHSYHLLEREYNETTLLLAGPLDVDDRNQLTQRKLTIILEARELVKIMDYPAPRWCAATK
jgi:hypothetical protein